MTTSDCPVSLAANFIGISMSVFATVMVSYDVGVGLGLSFLQEAANPQQRTRLSKTAPLKF
jgi:hypothetical protein